MAFVDSTGGTVSNLKIFGIVLLIGGFIFAKVYSFYRAGVLAIILGALVMTLSETDTAQ